MLIHQTKSRIKSYATILLILFNYYSRLQFTQSSFDAILQHLVLKRSLKEKFTMCCIHAFLSVKNSNESILLEYSLHKRRVFTLRQSVLHSYKIVSEFISSYVFEILLQTYGPLGTSTIHGLPNEDLTFRVVS